MSQSGYTPIQLYHSSTTGNTPLAGNLTDGELAINTADGVLFYKDSGGVVRTLASKSSAAGDFSALNVTGTAVISTNSTSDALRITQTGTGNALVVEDSTNPDSTPFVVNNSGQVIVGNTTAPSQISGASVIVQGTTAGNAVFRYNDTPTSLAYLNHYKSRGSTVGAPSAVVSGDGLGRYSAFGYDGTDYVMAAEIRAEVDGTVGTNDMPGRWIFATTKDGASSVTEAMRIDNQQRIGIGSVDTRAMFNIGSHTGTATGLAYQRIGGTIPSSATSYLIGYWNETTTPSGVATYAEVAGFKHQPATIGANSTITSMLGFQAAPVTLGAGAAVTNYYGFYGNTASGTGRFNLYMAGTADNYVAGALGLGATPGGDTGLKLAKNITGATTAFGCRGIQAIQSDVTTTSHQFISNPSTAAAAFTLGNLNHYSVFQGSIGSGSAITSQRGFFANSSITGATNNYGFYGDIAAGTGRYNLYMNGSADNQFNGNVLIFGVGGLGYTTGSGGAVTQITSRTTGVTLNKTNGAITLVSAAGLATYQSFTVTNSTVAATDTIIINQKSGTDKYIVMITAVTTGSFVVTFATTGGTTTEQPVFNFSVIKAVTA